MKKRRWWLLLLVVLLAFLLVLFAGKRSSVRRATLLVAVRGEAFSRAAEAALPGDEGVKTRDLLGTRHYNVWPVGPDASAQMVQFSIGAAGFGSETSYWGICTTTDGQPAGWPEPDMHLVPDGDGFSWREENGDNTYYTERIDDVWWYYRAEF